MEDVPLLSVSTSTESSFAEISSTDSLLIDPSSNVRFTHRQVLFYIDRKIVIEKGEATGQSMFGTSNFGTEVTSAPSCGLRHLMLTSAPC